MADLSGIIPALPSGGQMSQRQHYAYGGKNNPSGVGGNPNFFEFQLNQPEIDAYNTTIENALRAKGDPASLKQADYLHGHPLYGDLARGGYMTGFENPSDPSNPQMVWSGKDYNRQIAGGKIIPSQYTMTAAQSVGQAQFSSPFSSSGKPGTPPDPGGSFTTGPAGYQSQTPGPSSNQAFMFGNNGSAGSSQGTFGSTQAGQSSPFYQAQPDSMSANNPLLGTLQPLTPQQQALIQSR